VVTFHSGIPPNGFSPDFEPLLFNTKVHRISQSKIGWSEFHLLEERKKKILSSIYFNVSKRKAVSPCRAPFGGFEMSTLIQPKDFWDFTWQIEQALSKLKVNQIEIQFPPALYSTAQPLAVTTLISQGFVLTQSEAACSIIVDSKSLEQKMLSDKKDKLRIGQKAGLAFRNIPLSNLPEIYSFIETFRKKLNRTLSMSMADLGKPVKAMPKAFFIVGVFLRDQMISACICIRVSRSIVYTFYSAHDDAYDKLSPRVFLLSALYKWCQQEGVTLLDLGTSTLDGKPNFNLLDFKLRMGGTLTTKFSFRKILE
jgi:Acetyltransferase (GNAT) domain